MSGRGTQNGPNIRNPERPESKPSRLDQFADAVYETTVEAAKELSGIYRGGQVSEEEGKPHSQVENYQGTR